jgi:hypothetical protein
VALRIKDRVKQGTTTTGSGTINLDVSFSSSGFQDFSALGNGTETYYAIEEGSNFEIGLGTYNSNTLTRSTILDSSNGGAKIALNGNANVFVTYPADKAVFTDADNNATVTGLIVGQTGVKFNDGTIQTTAATSTSYTAGTGLALVGTEFSTSGTGTFTQINFDLDATPSYNEGTIFYDNQNKTLAVYNDEADITLQVGQEQYVRVRNNTTGTISNGQVVYINGSQGGTGPTVDLAMATGEATSQVIGLATHDIGTNSFGYVTSFGVVRDVDTSLFNDGDSVYVSEAVAGGLTGVPPVIPNYKAPVGHIIRSHPSNGTILVQIVAPKLGGGDAKVVNSDINLSGIPFYTVLANENAGGMSSNADFVYDSGNQRLRVGSIRFGDATVQTTAFTGTDFSGYATEAYVTGVSGDLQTQITTNANNIASTGATNAAAISTNSTDIATVSGLTVTNANNISSNDTDISNLSGLVATNTSDISTVSGLTVTNSNDIDTVSGLTVTNATNISNNSTDISTVSGLTVTNSNDIDTVSGLTVTNANNISTNSTDIDTVSGLTVTNANNISTNSTDIATVSGLTVTNANNISTNSTDIDTVSGLLYNSWTVTDGSNSEAISAGDQVKFTGEGNTTVSYDTGTNTVSISGTAAGGGGGYDFTVSDGSSSEVVASGDSVTWTGTGATTVSYNTGSNTFTINTPSSEAGYEGWTATDGNATSEIANGNDVKITGAGNVTVSFVSGSPNVFTVSGADQDLSSYATQAYVTGVSGHLQGQIDTNSTDISTNSSNITTVSGLTDTNATNINTVSGLTVTNATDITTVSGLTVTNATDIDTVSGLTVTNATDIDTVSGLTVTNATDIDTVSGLTVANATDINTVSGLTVTNATDIDTVSGLTVTNATDIGTVSGLTVTNASDIDTVSGLLYTSWTVTDGSNSEAIAGGDQVKFTGAGATTVAYSTANNTVTVTSTDNNTEYTAGTGLQLVGTEFNVSGIDSSMIVNGSVANADLANSSVTVTAGTGLSNGGAVSLGSSITIDADTATTSQVGVVQLQDSATDGTTDKAITPNAVYDISGALQTNIDGKDNYTKWVLQGDGATTTDIDSAETVQFTGAGNVSISLGGTDNRTVTISGNDVSNTYVAGSGLNEDPSKTFNVQTDNSTLEVNSDIVRIKDGGVTNDKLAGSIANTKLTNDSVTVTAGSGLSNGGEVDLGATITLDITPGGVTNDMLGGSIANDKLSNSSVSYGGVSVSLGASDATPAFNLTDATGYPTSSLVGTITNAQLAGSIDNSKLSNSSVTITAGTGLSNGGAVSLGSSVTIDADTATTSQVGVVQLQDSATDGTTDKAITPNAVYDISGVLQTNIDAKDNYTKWVLSDNSTTTNVDSNEQVTFIGAGATTISLGGADNRSVTITSTDNNTEYTAGTGLQLVGTEFNVSGIDSSMIVNGSVTNDDLAGSIANAKLVNDSVTVTAGSGLSNGGEVDLGASISIDITPGGVTAAMLNTDVTLDEITDHGATTTNNITVGMIDTSGVRTPISSGAFSATPTFDLSTASTFTTVMTANITSMTLSNVTAGQKFMLRLVQDGTGSHTATFFSGVSWAGGTTPTLTTTGGKADVFGFLCTVSGTYEGFIVGQNI